LGGTDIRRQDLIDSDHFFPTVELPGLPDSRKRL